MTDFRRGEGPPPPGKPLVGLEGRCSGMEGPRSRRREGKGCEWGGGSAAVLPYGRAAVLLMRTLSAPVEALHPDWACTASSYLLHILTTTTLTNSLL